MVGKRRTKLANTPLSKLRGDIRRERFLFDQQMKTPRPWSSKLYEINVKFNFRKLTHVKRYLEMLTTPKLISLESLRADAENLLQALPHSTSWMHKTYRVIQIPKRFWNWDYHSYAKKGPAFIFSSYEFGSLIVVKAGIPQKYLPTVVNHEVREIILSKAGYGSRVYRRGGEKVHKSLPHEIAVRKEVAKAPPGLFNWLKEYYPEAWKERFGKKKTPRKKETKKK